MMATTLVELLRTSSERFGPRTALLFKPGLRYRTWSYQQVWEESGKVAALLQMRGLKKGDRAVLWAPNCPQWVLAFFGCLRAGVVVVPLDVASARDFAERVVAKTSPVLAFVSRATPPAHRDLQAPIIYLEELEELTKGLPAPREVPLLASDLVEVMFTSGTTGNPKGVMLTHGNLLADLEASNHYIPGHPRYRLVSILPLSHMFEQMGGLFVILRCGANVTYLTSRRPTALVRAMQERRPTTLLLVPQALEMFMGAIEREARSQGKERLFASLLRVSPHLPLRLRRILFRRVHRRLGGCLEFVVSGGAALDSALGARWEALGVKVIQGYGATECSPVLCCHTLRRPRFDSVGLPLTCVQVKISEDGEVLAQGPNIMAGYWESPEETRSVFREGWYCTGDLGYLDSDGFLHLHGRKKDMIALASGQKVFPEDIEAVLRKHPHVADGVVVGLPKGSVVEVHAALLLKEGAAAAEVVAWANGQLAEHQHIRGFTLWPEADFPRTHTLKVKKHMVVDVLRGAAPGSSGLSSGSAPVQSPQRTVKHLVAEIGELDQARVTSEMCLGADCNLDSLRRVELLAAIEEELGVYLDEAQVGPNTTVQELEEMVARGAGSAATTKFPRWGMARPARIVRAFGQRGIIFPLARLTYSVTVAGKGNLDGLQGPVLFAANHNLHLDNPLILKAMPSRWRRRLAIAADASLWRNPFWRIANPLFGNGFPFSKEGGVRASLENLGRILDSGWSVLIYPEGELTVGGPMKPFKSGTGLLALQAGVPVVPVHLRVKRMGCPWQFPLIRRGSVEIRFGRPLTFPASAACENVTRTIQKAVEEL